MPSAVEASTPVTSSPESTSRCTRWPVSDRDACGKRRGGEARDPDGAAVGRRLVRLGRNHDAPGGRPVLLEVPHVVDELRRVAERQRAPLGQQFDGGPRALVDRPVHRELPRRRCRTSDGRPRSARAAPCARSTRGSPARGLPAPPRAAARCSAPRSRSSTSPWCRRARAPSPAARRRRRARPRTAPSRGPRIRRRRPRRRPSHRSGRRVQEATTRAPPRARGAERRRDTDRFPRPPSRGASLVSLAYPNAGMTV